MNSNTSKVSTSGISTSQNPSISISTDNYLSNNYRSCSTNDEYVINSMFTNIVLPEYAINALLSCQNIISKCNFDTIIIHQTVSMDFVRKYYDKISNNVLYSNYDVSIDFIEEHIDEYNENTISVISEYQKIPEWFINKYIDKLDLDKMLNNKNIKLSKYFILKYINKLKNYDSLTLSHYVTDEEFTYIFNYLQENNEDLIRLFNFKSISWNRELSEEDIFNNIDDIDFSSLKLAKRKFKDDRITCYIFLKYGN